MATDFKIDENGDIVTRNGDIVLVSGKDEIAQRITSRFRTAYREWVYDKRLGFPTVGQGSMFDNGTPLFVRLAMIRKYIKDTAGVTAISEFDVVADPTTKGLAVVATVQTEYGELQVGENL